MTGDAVKQSSKAAGDAVLGTWNTETNEVDMYYELLTAATFERNL